MYDLNDDRWLTNVTERNPFDKKVVLTFDDGPGRYLNRILDVLEEKQVQAMFFWGSRLLYQERPWKRAIEAGHMIGSHGHNHKNLASLNCNQQWKHIKGSIEHIQEITGSRVDYFRPPFGQYNEDTMGILKELRVTPVMWEITSFDWENKATPSRIVCNVLENVKEGSIVLLHELEQTVEILPELIDRIREKGLTL